LTANSSPIQNYEVPLFNILYSCTDLADKSGCFMTQEKRKFVVDCPFPIMEVCMANSTCLNINDHFPGPRVRHMNSFYRYRSPFSSRYNPTHFMAHCHVPLHLATGDTHLPLGKLVAETRVSHS
tara:strand:+ start:294 stop:665 length:372 start_codon:yes stop_codon:yes gene_type:complete